MRLSVKAEHLAPRLVVGGYVLHSGLEKLGADEATAAGLHGMATTAYPFLGRLEPARFVRLLACGEIAVGAALIAPVVPASVAGLALTGFSGGLLGLYARVPGLRREGSIWPTQQGIGISKDAWLAGIGAGLVVDGLKDRLARH